MVGNKSKYSVVFSVLLKHEFLCLEKLKIKLNTKWRVGWIVKNHYSALHHICCMNSNTCSLLILGCCLKNKKVNFALSRHVLSHMVIIQILSCVTIRKKEKSFSLLLITT